MIKYWEKCIVVMAYIWFANILLYIYNTLKW